MKTAIKLNGKRSVGTLQNGAVTKAKNGSDGVIEIQPANIQTIQVEIVGLTPLVQHAFSRKALLEMETNVTTKAADKKPRKVREARDFASDLVGAQHIAKAGWNGVPCAAFRNAMIGACRLVGMMMVHAKLGLWVLPDGFDRNDGTPLVKLNAGKPEELKGPVRLPNGSVDIRIRPMWREWSAVIQIQFDADMVSATSVVNLLDRAGRQCGIQEGRNSSPNSCGQGWGSFCVKGDLIKK